MAEHLERTVPEAAEAAVGRLGTAAAFRAREAAPASPAGLDLARTLAADIEFLGAVPSYARIHAQRSEALAGALDGIWPRSSPQRPATPAACDARCRDIVRAMDAPEAALARRIGELPGGEAVERLLADGRQALLLDSRLAAAGLDPGRLGETEPGRAAAALDALFGDHRILSRAALREAVQATASLRDRLTPPLPDMRRLVELAGLPAASPSQVALLARWLSSAPRPCPGPSSPGEAAAVAALEAEIAAARSLAEDAAGLDAAHGAAWRGEEPGKLEAAARILADPADPRCVKASAYAAGIGVEGPAPSAALSAMARARIGLRKAWPPACMADVAPSVPADLAADPEGALAHLRAAADWRGAAARTETLRRLHSALDALPEVEREALVEAAARILSGLQAIPPERRAGSAVALAEAVSAELASLEAHASVLAGFPGEVCEAARRPAGHLRERRACLDRIRDEPLFRDLAAEGPEALVSALAWTEAARTALPDGVDPAGRHAGLVHERAREVVAAAGEIMRMEAEARDRAGASAPAELVAAGRIALSEIKLAEARAEVEAAGGWPLVAWLESEGIEPELWGEALASRAVERAAAEPRQDPAPDGEATEPGLPAARERPTRLPVAAAGLAWRRVRVVPPQAALAARTLP